MKQAFERAKQAVERLFWDTCYVEIFREEETAWGETQHRKAAGDSFPCRLRKGEKPCGENGLLAQTEQTAILLYPAGERIPAGSCLRIRKENGEEGRYCAAGESSYFLTHNACGLKRRETI